MTVAEARALLKRVRVNNISNADADAMSTVPRQYASYVAAAEYLLDKALEQQEAAQACRNQGNPK